MTDKTGGPAFPNVPDGAGDKWADWDTGMTLRDYFAAKAMQGILVNTERNHFSFGKVDEIATKAYELSDAMLRAREK